MLLADESVSPILLNLVALLGVIVSGGGAAAVLGKWFTREVRAVVVEVVAPIKEDLATITAKNAETSSALISHMDDEKALKVAEDAARSAEDEARAASRAEDVAWRHEVTERLNHGDERFERVEAKIDKALAKPTNLTEVTGTVELHEAGS